MSMTDDLKPYDPRPEWMLQYHKEVDSGADKFKEWARSNLNIDIDEQLNYDQGTAKSAVAQQVLHCVVNQIPFILHNGPQRFCVIVPELRVIVIYAQGDGTTEILNTQQFQNRVKMLYVIYPQFSPVSIKLLKSALELAISQWKDNSPKQLPGT
jgi:hypothetical protein